MRVLVSYPGEHMTGASRYAAGICNELVTRGHELLAVVHGQGPSRALFAACEGMPVMRLDTPNLGRSPKEIFRHVIGLETGTRRLVRIIREFQPDVVLSHCVYNVWGTTAAKRAGVPAVALLHELPDCFPWPLYRIWTKWIGRKAHAVIVSSEEMHRSIRDRVPRAITIQPGIDSTVFRMGVDGREVRAELLPSGKGPLVVCASHLMAAKGQADLVELMPQLLESSPGIHLAIVGGTNGRASNEDYLNRLRERVRSLGLAPHVTFTGPRTDIAAVFAAADLVVYPSHHESFGMVPLESRAVGTPVVATDVGVAREFSERSSQVQVVPPKSPERLAQAILEALHRKSPATPLEREWTIQGSVDAIEAVLVRTAGEARPGAEPRSNPRRREVQAVGLAMERLTPPTTDWIRSVNLATTYYCNSRCEMCSIWELYRKDRSRASAELSLDEIRRIFSSRRFLGLRSVALTGGEPFLRRDLVDIAGFFLMRFPQAGMVIPTDSVSPGLTIRSVRRILEGYEPTRKRFAVSVSLDGLRDTHNRQRGVDCFDKAIEVLETLAPLDLALIVSFTITRQNTSDILPVYRLARELGADFSTQFGQGSSHYYGDRSLSSSEHQWREPELERVRSQITEIADERWAQLPMKLRLVDTSGYFMRRMVDYQRSPRRIFDCYSGTHSCFIDPYGDVYPCLMLDKKLGNAKRDGFDAVWDGPVAQEVRGLIARRECHCWTPCEACPSLGRSLNPQLVAFPKLLRRPAVQSTGEELGRERAVPS